MIILKESIHVQKDLSFVFKYTSDFGNIQDWDPGVILSEKKTHNSSVLLVIMPRYPSTVI
jgi:hypothetical protein